MDVATQELGWRELLASMDENTGTVDERIEVIRRRGEHAQDLARIERRRELEREAARWNELERDRSADDSE